VTGEGNFSKNSGDYCLKNCRSMAPKNGGLWTSRVLKQFLRYYNRLKGNTPLADGTNSRRFFAKLDTGFIFYKTTLISAEAPNTTYLAAK
jgi:hypothetical protein